MTLEILPESQGGGLERGQNKTLLWWRNEAVSPSGLNECRRQDECEPKQRGKKGGVPLPRAGKRDDGDSLGSVTVRKRQKEKRLRCQTIRSAQGRTKLLSKALSLSGWLWSENGGVGDWWLCSGPRW